MMPMRYITKLLKAEGGSMLVIWGVSFAIILGIVALSFDLGRLAITRTELQSFADSVALSAAGELDGQSDAITRSQAAAENLIADRKTFGTGGDVLRGSQDFTLTFLSDLPGSDTGPTTATTSDPAEAIYARVEVNSSTVTMPFGSAFSKLTGNTAPDEVANAYAIAGFTQYACDVTPLMFCLPSSSYAADEHVGEMLVLRSGGQGAAWGPGDFGFLDPAKIEVDGEGPCADKSGAQLDACLLGAIGSITQCFNQRGVDIEPGQKVGIEDAIFNVRFDIYQSIMNGKKNNPDYAPAPNVIKGVVPQGGGTCIGNSEELSEDTLGLPHDDCFEGGTCERFGTGNWSAGRADYVDANYGGTDPHSGATTRYAYYLAEIAAAGGASSTANILTDLSETGRPQCSPHQSNDPERRVIIAAGIDCAANSISGAANNVPVKEFIKIFLTEPVGTTGTSPPQLNIWGEIIGTAGGNGGGGGGNGYVFHDVVQLYR